MKHLRFKNNGFTLLEVLITVLIMSIGLLGLASMQVSGLKKNQSAYFRSQSTYLAYDIADRMRANSTIAQSGAYDLAMSATPSGAGIALSDLTEWKAALSSTLPAGDGSIARNGSVFTITVQWDDSRVDTTAGTQQFILTTQI